MAQKAEEITSGETVYFAGLDSGTRVDASSIKVLPQDASQDTSKWIIELDCAEEETFELSVAENYHPYEAGVKDKLNYKTYLRWQGITGTWPEQWSYEVYRGQEEDFVPSEENKIASDVKANYWAEMNVNYSKHFYYRIRAVEKDKSGKVIQASSYSNEISSAVIDALLVFKSGRIMFSRTGRIPPSPRRPLPLARFIRIVSAWSSRLWATAILQFDLPSLFWPPAQRPDSGLSALPPRPSGCFPVPSF